MKLVTRDTDYAVRAICYMAGHKENVSVATMVRELGMPGPFLRKILQVLNREGVLTSYKGIGGGFSLKALPENIFIADIMKIFQGPVKLNDCIFKKRVCPGTGYCGLKRKLETIERHVVNELQSISIGSLLK